MNIATRPFEIETAGSLSAGAPDAAFAVEWVDKALLSRIGEPWRRLAERAAEANPYLEAAFASAAISQLKDVAGFTVAAVWRTDRHESRLVALVPFAPVRLRWGFPVRTAAAMAHNYGPLGTPLLDREHGVDAMRAMFSWLRGPKVGARFLLIPYMTHAGAASVMVRQAMAELGLSLATYGEHERAMMLITPDKAVDIESALDSKKRKELRRLRRRLEDHGPVTLDIATEPAAVAVAVESFLALEEGGWKGQGGTATLQRADRTSFFRDATQAMAHDGRIRVYRLMVGDHAAVAGIVLTSQPSAAYWKIAFDEAYSRYSPGVQLTLDLTRDLATLPGLTGIDSTADPGHPMIDRIWPDRLAMADWLVDLTPGGSFLMRPVSWLEGQRRLSRERLRTLRQLIRARLRK